MMKSDNIDLTLGEFVKLLKSKNDVKNEGILENSDLSKHQVLAAAGIEESEERGNK